MYDVYCSVLDGEPPWFNLLEVERDAWRAVAEVVVAAALLKA